MHRFGRTAQKRMNDRWGGAFILAVVLAVVGAWKLGGWLGENLGGDRLADTEPVPGVNSAIGSGSGTGNGSGTFDFTSSTSAQPQPFEVHFVQVGAFRSEGAARDLVQALTDAGYTAAMLPKNERNLVRVYVGPYLTETAAGEAKSRLALDKATAQAFTVGITIDHNPEAVMAMTGAANSDLQRGLDLVNAYLHEAGEWFANRAIGQPADGGTLASLGNDLDYLASLLSMADIDSTEAKLLEMVMAAGDHAATMEVAATAEPGSPEFQEAISGYVRLLQQYSAFHQNAVDN